MNDIKNGVEIKFFYTGFLLWIHVLIVERNDGKIFSWKKTKNRMKTVVL